VRKRRYFVTCAIDMTASIHAAPLIGRWESAEAAAVQDAPRGTSVGYSRSVLECASPLALCEARDIGKTGTYSQLNDVHLNPMPAEPNICIVIPVTTIAYVGVVREAKIFPGSSSNDGSTDDTGRILARKRHCRRHAAAQSSKGARSAPVLSRRETRSPTP